MDKISKIFNAVDDFFSALSKNAYLNVKLCFVIFVALFLITIFFVIISTSRSYESRLIKAVDMFNNYFLDNPQITEDNLIAFNNKMKSRRVPKQLRKEWQQYVLYREQKASYYMSFENCVSIPVKNSTYTRDIKIMNILAYTFAALCLLLNLYGPDVEANNDIMVFFQQSLLCPILILVLNYLMTIFFKIRHNAIISDLYSNYQYFEVNIDKATETLPDYVDYEVLFDKNEIKRGIPILYAYLQKRADEEKRELERARLRNVEHEKFNFDEAGVERSLVLERAMTEAENYIAERKKLMQDMEQINNEIFQEENSFRETTKEYQRQMQVSKESFENFKQQLEDVTSSIEANYLKKQQQQELDRQRNLERDYDTATDKHKKVLETMQAELTDVENQIKKARNVLEKSMMSEFDTYSGKVYDEALRVVEEREADKYSKVQSNIKSLEEQLQSKESEVSNLNSENEQLKEQLNNIGAEYQHQIDQREQIISRVSDEFNRARNEFGPMGEQQNAQPSEQAEQTEQYQEQPAENYDEQYYDQYPAENAYNEAPNAEQTTETTGNAYQSNYPINGAYNDYEPQGLDEGEQPVTEGQPTYTFNYLDEEDQKPEEKPAEQNYTFNYLDNPEEGEQVKPDLTEPEPQVPAEEPATEPETKPEQEEEKEEPTSTQSGESDEDNSTVQNVESKPMGKRGRPRKVVTEAPVKKPVGRPKKVVQPVQTEPTKRPGRPRKVEQVEAAPAKRPGRPKKVEQAVEAPVKRAGRPRKEQTEVKPAPVKHAGRPKKVVEPVAAEPKKKAGRPRKVEQVETKPVSTAISKKRPGRPRKENPGQPNNGEINDIDAFLKEIDAEIAKENAKLEASKKELEKNSKFKGKK